MNEQPLIPITKSQLLDTPSLWFVLTNKCNLRCKYCYEETGDASLTEEMAVGFLDCFIAERTNIELSSEILEIILFGGEPTINTSTLISINTSTLISILEFIRSNRIVCVPRLVTNGLKAGQIYFFGASLHNIKYICPLFCYRSSPLDSHRKYLKSSFHPVNDIKVHRYDRLLRFADAVDRNIPMYDLEKGE